MAAAQCVVLLVVSSGVGIVLIMVLLRVDQQPLVGAAILSAWHLALLDSQADIISQVITFIAALNFLLFLFNAFLHQIGCIELGSSLRLWRVPIALHGGRRGEEDQVLQQHIIGEANRLLLL